MTLPLDTEAPRCADFSRAHEVDPGGTALAPDVVVLAETPSPWPKPAAKHPDLVALTTACAARPEQIRLLAAVPQGGERRLVAFRPTTGGALRADVPIGDDPAAALDRALDPENGRHVAVDGGPRTVLVCTQGSHDVCCGTRGTLLADALVAHHPELEVFRVSHTGGHRFAPTAMTLPDGRMWAYLDRPILERILERDLDPVLAASHCRGWWGAPTGPEQIAERAVFAELGWSFDEVDRTTSAAVDGERRVVTVSTDTMGWTVVVEPGRDVPAIACESPGGMPAKPHREWSIVEKPRRIA